VVVLMFMWTPAAHAQAPATLQIEVREDSAPVSEGAASVRIQGMRGRYTRFFSDGLPQFGEVRYASAIGTRPHLVN
jgi:hypothetical protein